MKSATGRIEKRSCSVVPIQVWRVEQPAVLETAMTENVSAHGARIAVTRRLRPSARLYVVKGGTPPLEATVIYCRPAGHGVFETGLHFQEHTWEASDAPKLVPVKPPIRPFLPALEIATAVSSFAARSALKAG